MDLPPDSFWTQTPRRLIAIFRARAKALQLQHDQRAWLAWHTAVLGRVEKIPPLSSLTAEAMAKPTAPQSLGELRSRLAAVFGHSGAQPEED